MVDGIRQVAAALAVLAVATACNNAPGEDGLRASFAEQLAANRFVRDFERQSEELRFMAPGPDGGTASWRVRIESVAIESHPDEGQPYKGTVKSAWYADGERIEPSGGQSNLPFELLSNGLSQDCWAFWSAAEGRWTWE